MFSLCHNCTLVWAVVGIHAALGVLGGQLCQTCKWLDSYSVYYTDVT